MSDQVAQLHRLAEQAQQEVKRDRRARCWVFHSWSKWQTAGRLQIRSCLGCDLRQERIIGPCAHVWNTYHSGDIFTPESGALSVGRVHDQQCIHCGDLRRLVNRNSP